MTTVAGGPATMTTTPNPMMATDAGTGVATTTAVTATIDRVAVAVTMIARAGTTMTESIPTRRRRRRAAPAGRILSVGLSTSATLGLVAVMGWSAKADANSPTPPEAGTTGEAAAPPVVVIRRIHVPAATAPTPGPATQAAPDRGARVVTATPARQRPVTVSRGS